MKVLFIGKRFYTHRDALSERFGRIYQLPYHWARSGTSVALWLIDYHSRAVAEQTDHGLEIESTPAFGRTSLRRFLREWTRYRTSSPRVIVASGDCYIGMVGYRLARHLRAKFVFDVYDKYDEFGGYVRLPGFDPFRFLLVNADRCLFSSSALIEKLGFNQRRGVYVPNGVDIERFKSLNKEECRAELGLPHDVPLVGYFGSMEPDRGVDDLIEAIGLVRGKGIPIELLIGGKSRPGLCLQREAVRYLGNLPFTRIPSALASCDVLALPYRRSTYLDMASSCKIAEYICAERPIVATQSPNLMCNFPKQAQALGEFLALPSDPEDLAEKLTLQLREQRLVDLPDGMNWNEIAHHVLRELEKI